METTMVIEKVKTAQPTTGKKELVIEKIEVGQWVRQGDIYVRRLPDEVRDLYEMEQQALVRSMEIARGHIVIASCMFLKCSLWLAELNAKTKDAKAYFRDLMERLGNGVIFDMTTQWVIPHAEHAKLVMPPGLYLGWAQTEVDPLTGKERQVLD